MGERTYTTSRDDARNVSILRNVGVTDLSAQIRKITVTDDGKLQIVLESEIGDEDTLNQVRNLLLA